VAKFLLVLAMIADLALAALLIGVSGFMFGSGPESMHAGALAAAGYIAAVIACIAAAIAGFVFSRRGKAALALAVAWMPVAGALAALMVPAPY
jgi:hypothetical protein